MAVLYITEYKALAQTVIRQNVAAPGAYAVAEQHLAIGASSVASAAFNTATTYIMVHTDAICSLAFGPTPTAVATAHRMAANETRFYGVNPGDKIAVITNT